MGGAAHQHQLADPEREGDVQVLGHERQPTGEGTTGKRRHVFTAEQDATRSWRERSRGDPKQRRLPHTVATDQADDFAGPDREVEPCKKGAAPDLRMNAVESQIGGHDIGPRAWARRSR